MNRIMLATLVLIFSLLSIGKAQDLVTDRPDFTESALVIPAKMIQIEAGAEYADFKSATDFSFPGVLARIGLGRNLEIRLGFSGWSKVTMNDRSNTYLNDLILEAKYQITNTTARIPMAVLLVSTLPTGDDEVSVAQMEIGIKFACSYDVNERFGLGANLGAISIGAGDQREVLSLASVALGIGVTDRLGAFIETHAEIPENASWQPVMDGGFTYLITPVAQADFYVGKGLNNHAADLIIGGGFSFRFGF